jgi:hypothetical protein
MLEVFVKMRTTRDVQLGLPGMIIPSIQITMWSDKRRELGLKRVSHIEMPVNWFPGVT